MAYITNDVRVKDILRQALNKETARRKIRDLPPQKSSDIRYLEWEINEALKGYKV